MLLSSVLLYASVSIFPAFAAPIPKSLRIRASAGWPQSTDDSQEKAFGISGNFKQSYLQEKEGAATLVATYPKGSYAGSKDPGIGGFIFEATGGVDLTTAKEAVLNYQVQFPEGFNFVLAGKIPGLYGGDTPEVAKTCAGGHHDDSCWSARLMWRQGGKGELYGYLPTPNQDLPICKNKCDVHYGASIDTGAWTFEPGKWTQITERVLLNDVGQKNAEIEISIEGKSVIKVTGLELRLDDKGRIVGVMVHTFFGGSSKPDYQTPTDQEAYFKDFTVEVTQKL